MKLLVGLGNPGPQYRDTRHNLGFLVIDGLARRWRVDDLWREKFDALVAKTTHGGETTVVAKPVTFMNLSGQSVAAISRFYKIAAVDILVIVDDVALPLGKLRARSGGSAGGHNGLKSVIECLGTQKFPRLRIGVGSVTGGGDLAQHVLTPFRMGEREQVEMATLRAIHAVEMFVVDGIERVMNAFNAAADNQQDPGPA